MARTSSSDDVNVEKGNPSLNHLEKLRTQGGHIASTDQPSLPVVHRRLANPAPLGLLSFATGIFLISILGVHARGIQTPNVLVGVLMFFGGVCHFIAGIMEFVAGNTFGATVFPSYAAFNFSYAMIFIPGTGIIASYTDSATGQLRPEFNEALAMYCWAWFILTVIYTVAAMRSSWVLFLTLFFLDVELLLLAAGYMANSSKVLVAANSIGFIVGFFAYWAGCAGLWADGLTPITLPVFPMSKKD
ncbi:GPR1/FUN34/yaaH family-domain-containing protein, partial [Paraphoma chrysanthemicola]